MDSVRNPLHFALKPTRMRYIVEPYPSSHPPTISGVNDVGGGPMEVHVALGGPQMKLTRSPCP